MDYIRCMKLKSLDLNLLVALDALLTESSVARAGARLGRSQPAVSHALRHLRHIFEDPLLVRVGHRMQPTRKAEELRQPLRELLEGVELLLAPTGFEPRTSDRKFRLMMPDLATSILMPRLVDRVLSEAPSVVLEVVGWRGPEVMTPSFAGSIDIIVSWNGDAFTGFHRKSLFTDRDMLAFRLGHPDASKLKGMDGFLAARHIGVVGAGEASDPIDDWLAEIGLARRVALVVPNYLQALQVAAASDLVAFAPGRMVASLGASLGLATCPPPVDPGEDQQFLFYPVRSARDPGSIWLRNHIQSVSAGPERPGPG